MAHSELYSYNSLAESKQQMHYASLPKLDTIVPRPNLTEVTPHAYKINRNARLTLGTRHISIDQNALKIKANEENQQADPMELYKFRLQQSHSSRIQKYDSPSKETLHEAASLQKALLINIISKHQTLIIEGKTQESVAVMLNRIYNLTETQLQKLAQFDMEEKQNYTSWVNKNFKFLVKREKPSSSLMKLPQIKAPFKVLSKDESLQLLKTSTKKTLTAGKVTFIVAPSITRSPSPTFHDTKNSTFYTQNEDEDYYNSRNHKNRSPFRKRIVIQEYETQIPKKRDPLEDQKKNILHVLDLIQKAPPLSERDLGLSADKQKVRKQALLASVMKNFKLQKLAQDTEQGEQYQKFVQERLREAQNQKNLQKVNDLEMIAYMMPNAIHQVKFMQSGASNSIEKGYVPATKILSFRHKQRLDFILKNNGRVN